MNTHMTTPNYPHGCAYHREFNCGCPGYPTLQNVLRECGNDCVDRTRNHRCVRCQAADMIDTLNTRTQRYLDRIIHLQDTIDRYEAIRDMTNTIWNTQPKPWDND